MTIPESHEEFIARELAEEAEFEELKTTIGMNREQFDEMIEERRDREFEEAEREDEEAIRQSLGYNHYSDND